MSEAGGAKQGWAGRIKSSAGRLSIAAWSAIVVGVMLVIIAAVVWTIFALDPTRVPWRHAITWPHILTIVLLMAAIPLLVWWCVRLFLEVDPSRFPDIDFAWKEGLAALRRQGISLESAPVFLVLGASDEAQERSIMQAAGVSLRVRGEPEGPAPLHWHANPDGIYLFCSDIGWLSAINAQASQRQSRSAPTRPLALRTPRPAPAAPPPAPAPAAASLPPGGAAPAGGTIMLEHFVSGSQAPVAEPRRPAADGSGQRASAGTMMLNEPFRAAAPSSEPAAEASYIEPHDEEFLHAAGAAPDTSPPLEPKQVVEQLQRLEYLGRLLRRERHPLCPINGILALIPLAMLEGALDDAQEAQRAVKSDLAAAQRSLQLRCPVTALVVGMEREPGFRELVRRVGQDRAAAQRFGRRFETRALASVEQMAALCIHVCGVFEDWVYTLFREEGAMARPGNTRLFGLLCKVRCNLQGPLMEVLAGGFGHDPQTAMTDEPTAFSGCYFAATGPTPDRQAFVRGVFEKILEEQEDVEWTPAALAAARRMRAFTYGAFLVSGLGIIALAAAISVRIASL